MNQGNTMNEQTAPKSVVFYSSPTKTNDNQQVGPCFVRYEVKHVDPETALMRANPRKGETVLNSVAVQ